MQIAEMRAQTAANFEKTNPRNGGFPNAPDWAVRRMFEKRKGLSLTTLPSGVEVRSLRSLLTAAPRKSAVSTPVEPEVPQEDFEMRKRRLAFLKAI